MAKDRLDTVKTGGQDADGNEVPFKVSSDGTLQVAMSGSSGTQLVSDVNRVTQNYARELSGGAGSGFGGVFAADVKFITVTSTVDVYVTKTSALLTTAAAGGLDARLLVKANTPTTFVWGGNAVWITNAKAGESWAVSVAGHA